MLITNGIDGLPRPYAAPVAPPSKAQLDMAHAINPDEKRPLH